MMKKRSKVDIKEKGAIFTHDDRKGKRVGEEWVTANRFIHRKKKHQEKNYNTQSTGPRGNQDVGLQVWGKGSRLAKKETRETKIGRRKLFAGKTRKRIKKKKESVAALTYLLRHLTKGGGEEGRGARSIHQGRMWVGGTRGGKIKAKAVCRDHGSV